METRGLCRGCESYMGNEARERLAPCRSLSTLWGLKAPPVSSSGETEWPRQVLCPLCLSSEENKHCWDRLMMARLYVFVSFKCGK